MKKILFALVIFSAVFMSCDSGMTSISVESVELGYYTEVVYGSEIELDYVVIYSDGSESGTLFETFSLIDGVNDLTKTVDGVESNISSVEAASATEIIFSTYSGDIVYADHIALEYTVIYSNDYNETITETFYVTEPGNQLILKSIDNTSGGTYINFEDWRLIGGTWTWTNGTLINTYKYLENGEYVFTDDSGDTNTYNWSTADSVLKMNNVDYNYTINVNVNPNEMTIEGAGNLTR